MLINIVNKEVVLTKIVELSDDNFDKYIANSDKPVLVDFFAPWCGHCRVQSSILDTLAPEVEDAVIAKINVDENREKAAKYFISGIPAILIFKNSKLVEQKAGVHQKDELKKLIAKYK